MQHTKNNTRYSHQRKCLYMVFMYSQENDIFEEIYAFGCCQSTGIYTVFTWSVQRRQYLVGGGASLNMEP